MRPAAGGLAVALIAGLALTLGTAATAQTGRVPTANVTAYAANGTVLSADPVLLLGQPIRIVVTGFAPNVAVRVHEAPDPDASPHADGSGVLTMLYTVPRHASNGDYQLTFSGDPPLLTPTATATPRDASGDDDPQTVVVLVPTIGLFPFRIYDPSNTTSPTASPTASVSGTETAISPSPSAGGQPASTGTDVAAILAVALTTLAIGLLILGAGRRQRPAHVDGTGSDASQSG